MPLKLDSDPSENGDGMWVTPVREQIEPAVEQIPPAVNQATPAVNQIPPVGEQFSVGTKRPGEIETPSKDSEVSQTDTDAGVGPTKYLKMAGVWKSGQRFQGIDSTTGEYISGRIINRAGKVKGVNKDCYNIIRY